MGQAGEKPGPAEPVTTDELAVQARIDDDLTRTAEKTADLAVFWQRHFDNLDASSFPLLPSHLKKPQADAKAEHQITYSPAQSAWDENTICRAALAVLLARYTHASEALFGITLNETRHSDDGYTFVSDRTSNVMPIRLRCDPQLVNSDLFQAITDYEASLREFEHADLDSVQHAGDFGPSACSFQTVLAVTSTEQGHDDAAEVFGLAPCLGRALLLHCHMTSTSTSILARYDSSVMEERQMSRFLRQLGLLIGQFRSSPLDQPVADLDIITTEDCAEIEDWNSALPPRYDVCLHDVVAEKAREAPDSPAVHAWDGKWSHAELDSVSSRLARYIQSLKLDSGHAVPLCFEKSKWMVAGVLAVLKAGHAFALVDPAHPKARVSQICRQTSATFAFASRLHHNVFQGIVPRTIVLDDDLVQSLPEGGYTPVAKPHDLAYIIFTSGSTGEPKGAMLEHRAFASCALQFSPFLGIDQHTRSLQFSSYAFGSSLAETMCTLMHGGCVCIPSDHDRMNDVSGFIKRARVNWSTLTPSFVATLPPESLSGLRTLLSGGEPFSAYQRDSFSSHIQVFNSYGQSESATICSASRVYPETKDLQNIGRTLGARSWITEPNNPNRLAAIGCVGELVIESPGIARGYVVPLPADQSPFLDEAPAWYPTKWRQQRQLNGYKFYRTGDLVSYRSDGTIVYLGRKDSQVKIRGQRVELGDVEAHLRHVLPSHLVPVAEAVLRSQEASSTALVAFLFGPFQPDEAEHHESEAFIVDSSNARRFRTPLQQTLPDYAVPSYFIRMRQRPTIVTGKTDRKRLRSLGAKVVQDFIHKASSFQPELQLGEAAGEKNLLRDLWFRSLQLSPTSHNLEANFFELGGDSIAAIKLVNMAKLVGLKLAVTDIFQNPTVKALEAVVRRDTAQGSTITTQPYQGPVELSYAQGRLWFLEQLNQGSSWYHVPFAERLRGPLKVEALDAALNALRQRHEALRTTFQGHEGVGMQIIQQQRVEQLRVIDVSSGQSSEDLLRQEQTRPFNLTGEPGWRVALLRVGEDDHILSIVFHHIISDGWTVDLMRKELGILYSAACRGDNLSTQLSPLAIQYRDFAIWQKQETQVLEHQRQLEYWVKQLADNSPAELLCDKPRPSILSGKAGEINFGIEGDLFKNLEAFCSQYRVTPFSVLFAAFRATHYRLTGADDATIAVPVANRNLPELEDLMGFFVNTQCIRTAVEDKQSFYDLVQQVRSVASAAWEYQDVPFEHLVSALLPASRDTSRNPLAQIAFALHSQQDFGRIHLEGVHGQSLPTVATTRFDLEFHLYRDEHRFRGHVLFASDLFEHVTMDGMVSNFMEVLRRGLDQPQTRIATLPLTDGLAEVEKMGLHSIDRAKYPRDASLVDIFREQAAANPKLVAVTDSSPMKLTYAELDEQSDKLSSWLRHRNLAPETLVAVFAPRSCYTILALLAILKANLAYLPLDVKTPIARNNAIMSAVPSCNLVLLGPGSPKFDLELSRVAAIPIIGALDEADTLGFHGGALGTPQATSLAYVMFTSGSTGKPKGVMVEHRGIIRLVSDRSVKSKLPSRARVAHMSNTAFDASTWEMWSALLNGGTVVCIDYFTTLDVNALESVFMQEQVQAALLPPSLLKQCLAHNPGLLAGLDVLLAGGDRFDGRDAIRAKSLVRGSVFNAYGPTENTVISTIYEISDQDIVFHNGVPVGHAISNSGAYIMDSEQQLVPLGVMGELVVTGDGLARGYTTQALDKDSFVQIAISKQPTRAYRTGDRVRYRPTDGKIEFFGRIDQQLKIRGHRIEPAEIEQAMLRHASVVDAAVVIRKFEGEEPEIIGYFVAQDVNSPNKPNYADNIEVTEDGNNADKMTERKVWQRLRAVLPPYMVPKQVIMLERMPLNANGKIDRRELGSMAQAAPRSNIATENTIKMPPRNEIEAVLCEEFAAVLEVEVGINDDFFDLGGHSLIAMKLAARISRKLDVSVTVKDIFDRPILLDLAATLRKGSNQHSLIVSRPYDGPVEQSFAQARLWFLERLYPGLTWYLSSFATRLRGPLNLEAVSAALSALEERHEGLRTTFQQKDGMNVQIVHPFTPRDLRVIDISGGSEEDLMEVLQKENSTPFDLEIKPGWRPAVIRLSDEYHVLSIVMHHIISDGWSLEILQRELATFYAAALAGKDLLSQVSPLPIHYRDFALWQREETQVAEQDRQLAYWKERLNGSKPATLLCDKPRPAMPSGKADVHEFVLKGTLYEDLHRFCRKHHTTPFAVLFAAFRATHFRLTGDEDVTIGTPIANRNRQELEDLVGFFVNLQCIRISLAEDETFETLVKQVVSAMAAASANQDVPFDRLVAELRPGTRDISRHPLVQITLAVHYQKDLGLLQIGDLDSEPLNAAKTSRFDLEFHFFQQDNSLRGVIMFSNELFDPVSMKSMEAVFHEVLRRGLEEPSTPIASMPLTDGISRLTDEGLLQVARTEYPRDANIPSLFREQVALCGDAIAVKDGQSALTYRELNRQTDQLACWLNQQGFEPETMIGVLAPRSCEAIVALLGILKANLAYLPLDINAPLGRLESILSSIKGKKLILTGVDVTAPALKLEDIEFLPIEEAQGHPCSKGDVEKLTPLTATSLAYVMFTSGSTGNPKGVMIEHRGIIRLVKNTNIQTQTLSAVPVGHIANLAFDAATWEIYTALLNGGSLVCIDHTTVLDTAMLCRVFKAEKVRAVMFTPALLKQCLAESPSTIKDLELLFASGDRLDVQDALTSQALAKGGIINALGHTENTVYSTAFRMQPQELCINGVPVGRAISNSGALVLDPNQRVVPLGVMGELVLTGDGVARGYTEPRLNHGRFIEVTINGETLRAYRTGDRARYRPSDAQMEFFGRIDQQVKIRGFRVEPAEVEKVLLRHPSIRDAAIVIRKQEDHGVEMVSFIAAREEDLPQDTQDDVSNQVEGWGTHFETSTYVDIDKIDISAVGNDFMGWISMYDGKDIDKREMQEWLDDTMATILDDAPAGQVLEIGTGSGMILFNLGKGLERYIGLDPSSSAVNFVNGRIQAVPAVTGRAHVYVGTATDVAKMEGLRADTAVINSVAQYFPSREYLLQVINSLIHIPGMKRIVFGDMRSWAINHDFLAARALHSLGPAATKDEIKRKILELEEREEEFLVDPAFFTGLVNEFPDRIWHVEAFPKRMKATNELSAYRFQAVIHVREPNEQARQPVHAIDPEAWIDLKESQIDQDGLAILLRDSGSAKTVPVRNVPFRRTIVERMLLETLDDSDTTNSVDGAAWISSVREKAKEKVSLSPFDLVQIGKAAGFRVEFSCARQRSQAGAFDAVFHRLQPLHENSRVLIQFPTEHKDRVASLLTNSPLQRQRGRKLEAQMRDYLQNLLPSYMIPVQIIALPQLPINANGKVDRRQLTQRAQTAQKSRNATAHVAPRNEVEAILCEEFASVLGVDIGATDNFFDLGGHSLMATKVAARLSRRIRSRVSVKNIFDHPVIEDLAAIVLQSSTQYSNITAQPYNGPVQQSFAQGRLWFLHQLELGNSSGYHMPIALRLSGPLDTDALQIALDAVQQRHETLRTTFEEHDGVGVQIVQPIGFTMAVRMLEIPDGKYEDILRDEQLKPFDLGSEPAWRVAVLRVNKEDHVISIIMHHIISDGLSFEVLQRELAAFYRSALRGQDPLSAISPLPIQYRDFAEWERQDVQMAEYDRQLAYWRKELAGSQPATLLCDKPRPAKLSGAGALEEFFIEGSVYERLQSFCRTQQVTLFNVLLAAFRAAHFRLTGDDDATIGTPTTNRSRSEVEDLIGFFVNTQCMRIPVGNDQTFDGLVRQVRSTITSALENKDVPFERVVSDLLPGSRNISQNPLVQLIFAVHAAQDLGKIQLEGLTSKTLSFTPTTRFDFEFHLFQDENKLRGAIFYSTDLFEAKTVQGVVEVFQEVLRLSLAQPQTPIASLRLVDGLPALRETGLLNLNQSEYPRDSSVVEVFLKQVAVCPETIAVKDSFTGLTYAQLNEQSDKLASWLRGKNFAPETLVGVFAPRSCETIVALLAILKANLAYLPFDVNIPTERLESILAEVSGNTLILIGEKVSIPDIKASEVEMVRIHDLLRQHYLNNDAVEAVTRPQATSLAYVMFTSGSTGRPKGVMIEHRGIVRLVKNNLQQLQAPAGVKVAHMSNLAFDATTWEIYSALLNGGTIICIDQMTVLSPSILSDKIQNHDINTAFFTAALLRQILEEEPAVVSNLDVLLIGGDTMRPHDAFEASKLVRRQLFNAYGPTENTTFSAMFVMDPNEQCVNGVPIGSAIKNSGAYIMDSQQHLVPLGVIGELVVTGDGLARGYTDASLDINRFVHITVEGQSLRAYRTGDRARYRIADGKIEFFGRTDTQVKIRGYRIETAEVEQAITDLAEVRDAAVVIRKAQDQQPDLVAFVMVNAESESGLTETQNNSSISASTNMAEINIRKRLQGTLPAYMVPAQIIVVDHLPLNANAKVDLHELKRRALTVPRTRTVSQRVAPRNEVEAALCEEYAKVLGLDVGITDNFFDLGGHSLMATKLAARISRRLHASISVKDVFDQPILVDLAGIIHIGSSTHAPITPMPYRGPVRQSFAQGRLWFLETLHTGSTWYLMPLGARLRGPLRVDALAVALNALRERHETLRTTFTEEDGIGMQVIHPYSSKELEIIDLSSELDSSSYLAPLEKEQRTIFDLSSEPGLRVKLYKLGNDDHVLSIVMHHIVSDGWSVDILRRELCLFYAAALRGDDPLLRVPPLPIQYRDFALWQKADSQVAEQERQLNYWTEQLSNSIPAEFFCDKPRRPIPSGQGGFAHLTIEGSLYEDLQTYCRVNHFTSFAVLLAAFRATHFRLTGAEDATIGTPIANRNRPELEEVIGFFVNAQCIRTMIEEDETFESLVRQVRTTATAAFENQDVPFENLVTALQPNSGDVSRNPLIQLMFALHSQHDLGRIPLEGVVSERISTPATARLDLEFHLFQEEGRLDGTILFATDLFEAATIQNIIDVFQQVLIQGLKQPGISIATMPLTDGLTQTLATIARTDYPRDSSVVDVFAEHVSASPNKIAIKDSSSEYTYQELDERSGSLAAWLQRQGFAPETPIVVLAPRSCETVIALLGILKSEPGLRST